MTVLICAVLNIIIGCWHYDKVSAVNFFAAGFCFAVFIAEKLLNFYET